MDKDKTAGKFAWFCVGTWMGARGISKLMHIIYITVIIILLLSNELISADNAKRMLGLGDCTCRQSEVVDKK